MRIRMLAALMVIAAACEPHPDGPLGPEDDFTDGLVPDLTWLVGEWRLDRTTCWTYSTTHRWEKPRAGEEPILSVSASGRGTLRHGADQMSFTLKSKSPGQGSWWEIRTQPALEFIDGGGHAWRANDLQVTEWAESELHVEGFFQATVCNERFYFLKN